MKNIGKLAVLGAVMAASASLAFADTVTVSSYSSTGAPIVADTNGATFYNGVALHTFTIPNNVAQADQTPSGTANQATYTLNPGTIWSPAMAGSAWVGFAASNQPGGLDSPQGDYTYTTSFMAAGGLYSGSLGVMSDDTVETILNYGTINALILNHFSAIGTDQRCADSSPNCTTPLFDTVSGATLFAGKNTLTFIVEQAGTEGMNLDATGLDFAGSLSQSTTPEPSSLVLLGTGLVSAAGMLFRRRQVTA